MPHSFIFSSDGATTAAVADARAWQRFLVACLGFGALFLMLMLSVNIALLGWTGELMPQGALVDHQRKTGGLYRSATSNDVMKSWFRFERFDYIQPEIVVVGSSRSLQFRQEHF